MEHFKISSIIFVWIKFVIVVFLLNKTTTVITLAAASSSQTLNSIQTCEELRNIFSKSNSQFFACALQNSEPVTFCQACIDTYIDTVQKYQALAQGNETDSNNTVVETCADKYFIHNRLNLVQNIYLNSEQIWTSASCSNCFDWENNTLTKKLSQETIDFYVKLNTTTKCIVENAKKHDICKVCNDKYADLNDYYNGIKKSHQDLLCFDVKDAMNKTRFNWSSDLKCCRDKHSSMLGFFIASSMISSIPILFYMGFYFYTKRQEMGEFIYETDDDNDTTRSMNYGTTNNSAINRSDGSSGMVGGNRDLLNSRNSHADVPLLLE